ncbi:hypothetical protein HPB47_000340 [Ixodes persulcatus]|uniref:Uncharacterized protein n=1 Tax=Ixodes persulcatus TaxID=34615 RepID=A0AC60PS46_IXOPE|nr:hypothetical protein HPB47_000340 [Ixodes persulcatus]
MVRADLLEVFEKVNSPGTIYRIDNLGATFRHEVLQLSPFNAVFSSVTIIAKHKNQYAQEMLESLAIEENEATPTRMKRHRGSVGQYRKQLPSLGEGMDSLLDPLNPKSGLDHWDNEHTDVRGSVLHQGDPGDGAPLKKSHAGSVPAYKKELREVNRLLLDLLTELDHRKVQWTS